MNSNTQQVIIYPAIFEEENEQYNIVFPDFDNAATWGKDLDEAIYTVSVGVPYIVSDCPTASSNFLGRTKELESIILSSVPRYKGQDGRSNVQRTFQAIRIEVNGELDALKEVFVALRVPDVPCDLAD